MESRFRREGGRGGVRGLLAAVPLPTTQPHPRCTHTPGSSSPGGQRGAQQGRRGGGAGVHGHKVWTRDLCLRGRRHLQGWAGLPGRLPLQRSGRAGVWRGGVWRVGAAAAAPPFFISAQRLPCRTAPALPPALTTPPPSHAGVSVPLYCIVREPQVCCLQPLHPPKAQLPGPDRRGAGGESRACPPPPSPAPFRPPAALPTLPAAARAAAVAAAARRWATRTHNRTHARTRARAHPSHTHPPPPHAHARRTAARPLPPGHLPGSTHDPRAG